MSYRPVRGSAVILALALTQWLAACGGGGSSGGSNGATNGSAVTAPAGDTPVGCTLPAGVDLGKVGSAKAVTTMTQGGVVLMGGNRDVTEAMRWMITRSGGGDFVVVRATGGAGYNRYIYDLGGVNSVQTLLIDSVAKANDACVESTLRAAAAVFIAGGNQADYINFFKGQKLGKVLAEQISSRKVPVGGTSAGMAILGNFYHPGGAAEDESGLQNPSTVALGSGFLSPPLLANVVTEPHFSQGTMGAVGTLDSPKRTARLVSFMAKAVLDGGASWQAIRGITADNDTAVAIDANGVGRVFVYPGSVGNANFVRAMSAPEMLASGTPLSWMGGGRALSVQEVAGTVNGSNAFDVVSWTSGSAVQRYWAVNAGVLSRSGY